MKPFKLTDNVEYMCVNHFNRRLFDALIPLPQGTSYNSYLVRGAEKTAVIDAADPEKIGVLLDYLKEEKKIDYIIAQHAEQDHSGGITGLLAKYPDAMVVTNPKCKELLMTHLHVPAGKFIEVKDGAELDLGGGRKLKFVYTPWVHWPETMCTWLESDGVLFTCDFFGSHLATPNPFSDPEDVYEPMKRYYAEIMMPFRQQVKADLEKISGLPAGYICPSHGPVHKGQMPGKVKEYYTDWAVSAPKNKVVLAYVSMHGSTLVLVNRLYSRLQELGVHVEKLNLEEADTGRLAMSLVDAATIMVGTPMVLAGAHPRAIYAAYLVNALRPKARWIGVLGSFGWGGKLVESLAAALGPFKAEVLPPVLVKGLPLEDDLKKVDALAEEIAKKHATIG
ncbi:MAG TPA: FprA family A-type flavoprotein [Elusimicrobiales bacterium]|nr:FprA family A-type flavoprotein [Elusimicrobiales bacterium]